MTIKNMEENESGDAAEDQVETPDSPPKAARRPMNSYFIFCKKHRDIVKLRHPSSENRSISRHLGDWWSSLSDYERKDYSDLAQKLKDRFFHNNPDFQWYKFPEPTRRSIMVRPCSSLSLRSLEDNSEDTEEWSPVDETPTNNNNPTKINYNVEPSTSKFKPDFTPGKLADEAQMGGLNSLMLGSNENHTSNKTNNMENDKEQQNPHESFKLKKLQDELLETSKAFESLDDDNGGNEYTESRKRLFSDVSSESDDLRLSQRSCKGKRYEELKNNWGVVINNKRPKRETTNQYQKSSRQNTWRLYDGQDSENELTEGEHGQSDSTSIGTPKEEDMHKKVPKLSDFDLDKELAALKPLDYDAYLAKKRENLNRKKNPVYQSNLTNNKNNPREQTKLKLVGSGKRKPKKEIIKRLDVNSTIIQPENNKEEIQYSTTSESSAVDQKFYNLHTLAEVASRLLDEMNAKNASSESSM